MPGSRESSVWRTLAVAFGDGLAFGVGLTLTNNATRAATSKTQLSQPDLQSLGERLAQVEQRLDRARLAPTSPPAAANTLQIAKVAEAVLTAMDSRFGEVAAEAERRLAEVEERIKSELEALDARQRDAAQNTALDAGLAALRTELTGVLEAQRLRAESDVRVLRSQMLQVHKEFAETLARLVDEQIEHTIALRLQAIQEQMRETVREESQAFCAGFGKSLESQLDARLQALREERGGLEREIADLHVRLDSDERGLFDTMRTLGHACLQAADRMPGGTTAPSSPLANGGGRSLDSHITAAPDTGLPEFARRRTPGCVWRIPAVSGFLLATTGLLALHYLVV